MKWALENKTSGMSGLKRGRFNLRSSSAPACRRAALLALVVMTWTDLNATELRGKLTREYELKADFLFNFAHFVEWPSDTFADTNAPIVIGVLGDDPFGSILDKIAEGETIQNRKLVIKRSRQVKDLKDCQVLFIGKSERNRLRKIFASLDEASILTVGETAGFAQLGGVTRFFLQGNRLRFEVNLEAARHNGLKISAQLLDLGTGSLPAKGGN
jgi:hypothetical protein